MMSIDEMAIMKRTEKAMFEVKLIEKRGSQELTDLLGLVETFDRLAKQMKSNGIGML